MLHWLDVPERVKYKLGVITRRCAPRYLAACCVQVSTAASRQHLLSAASHQQVIPSHRLTTYGRRAFSVAGPMFWNSLPRNMCDLSHRPTAAVLGRSLKTFLFLKVLVYIVHQEVFATMRYINWCFTYLLTYLLTSAKVNGSLKHYLHDMEHWVGMGGWGTAAWSYPLYTVSQKSRHQTHVDSFVNS